MPTQTVSTERPTAVGRRPSAAKLVAILPYLIALAALAYLVWATVSTLTSPGLDEDELVFVPAATGKGFSGGDSLFGIPTLVYPYVGALKSWLHAPWFDVVGVTPKTIRAPMVAVEVVTVVVAFQLARRLFGVWAAALLVLLLATDPAYMNMAKADYGPVALSALLRVCALFCFFHWLRTSSSRWLWGLVAAIALGVFNKIDFGIFALGLAVAAVLVYRRDLIALARRRTGAIVTALGVLAAALVVLSVEIIAPASGLQVAKSPIHFPERISDVGLLFVRTFNGTDPYLAMTGRQLDPTSWFEPAAAAILVLSAAVGVWWEGWGRRRPATDPVASQARATTFLLVVFLAMFTVMLFIPQIVGPQHALLLWPLPELLAAGLVGVAWHLELPRWRIGVTAALAIGIVVLAVSQIRASNAYHATLASGRDLSGNWSTEIYDASAAVNHAAPNVDRVVTADWGIAKAITVLGTDEVGAKINDDWQTFSTGTPGDRAALLRGTFRGRRVLVLTHPGTSQVMANTNANLRALIAALRPADGVHPVYAGRQLVALDVDDRR